MRLRLAGTIGEIVIILGLMSQYEQAAKEMRDASRTTSE